MYALEFEDHYITDSEGFVMLFRTYELAADYASFLATYVGMIPAIMQVL